MLIAAVLLFLVVVKLLLLLSYCVSADCSSAAVPAAVLLNACRTRKGLKRNAIAVYGTAALQLLPARAVVHSKGAVAAAAG
jgi:hypothetical protein